MQTPKINISAYIVEGTHQWADDSLAAGMGLKLNPRQKAVWPLWFGHGLRQCEIAAIFGIKQSAISTRVAGIYEAYRKAGMNPPQRPGEGLRRITPIQLSVIGEV